MNAKGDPGIYVIAEAPDILGRMETAVAAMRSTRQARSGRRRAPRSARRPAYTHRLLTAAPALLLAAASLDAALCAFIA